ncbi:MAG: hypothetical protein H0T65_26845 [Deltaproteobacteria bacterium]|nr:hypothetical protein [Deltaproteobacteria bacterium]
MTLSACVLEEATDEDITEVESESATATPITTLTDDDAVTVSLAPNTIRYFKLEVPSGFDRVSVYRSGYISSGPRFYMRRNQLPTPTNYDCTNSSMGCGLEMPVAGTYYIAVHAGSQSYPSFTFAAGYNNLYSPIPNGYSASYYNQYGVDRKFKLVVPTNVSSVAFTYTLDPAYAYNGRLDMVVKRNAFANDQNYDCIKWIIGFEGLTTVTCTFTNPTAGTYYVALLGYGTKTVGTFSARYKFALVNAPLGAATN